MSAPTDHIPDFTHSCLRSFWMKEGLPYFRIKPGCLPISKEVDS